MSVVPRWCTGYPGDARFAERTVGVPAGLGEAVSVLAGQLNTAERDVLLAAHLAVLAVLTQETDVSTCGYGAGLVRIRLADGSWESLIEATRSAVERAEPGVADTGFAVDGSVPSAKALAVVFSGGGDRLALRLRYRTDLFDTDYVDRIGGYLLQALWAMSSEPGSQWGATDLLSAEERQRLVHGLAGRVRALPDHRFADLFAAQAAQTPNAPAIIYGGQIWSYQWLDRAANRVANALLGAGLAAEDVVAVATKRDPAWAAALIGVLRAGGVYLPVEPSLPPARAAELVRRSGCRVMLTDADTAGADMPGDVRRWTVGELLEADQPDTDPGVPVKAGSVAYIYFTSGSTGAPKGAMCEHLGMVNHLYAKIDGLGLGPDDVVVQNAQSSFDISLWQLTAPLVVGGRTLIVEPETILDAAQFLDVCTRAGASILQVVPSYLEVLLRYLERHPRDVGRLRFVSVTGEAVSKALVTRWLAAFPSVPLVNAYGATEASDDTAHEFITEPPATDLVPVGRPVGNVGVYILDRRGDLAPLGAIGEIAFSGICVGRGYVGDPEGTAEVFGKDPFVADARMYRTGDYGRWLPSGSIEFHGRRDEQVKIRGARIELGEIENRMCEHLQVDQASVVVLPDTGSGKQLVGFYTAKARLIPADLASFLAATLPNVSCPARLIRLDALPLTSNGKTDKQELLRRVRTAPVPVAAPRSDRPVGATESRIAEAWAAALGRPVDTIGRGADFFALGGTSLSALRVVVALDGLISLDDLVRVRVLHQVAALADNGGQAPKTLLRPLIERSSGRVLVCMPYAAGGAIDFHALARAVGARDARLSVYAVQPPGHDLGRHGDPLLGVVELAQLLAGEMPIGALTLWGHGTGAVLALETARQLAVAGRPVRRVFLGGYLLVEPRELLHEIATVVGKPDHALGAGMATQGGLDLLSGDELAGAGRVYRHDTRAASQYLLDADQRWGTDRLACPLTVVVSTTDPTTHGYRTRYRDWARFAEQVELAVVEGGGNYFPRTRADSTAEIIVAGRQS